MVPGGVFDQPCVERADLRPDWVEERVFVVDCGVVVGGDGACDGAGGGVVEHFPVFVGTGGGGELAGGGEGGDRVVSGEGTGAGDVDFQQRDRDGECDCDADYYCVAAGVWVAGDVFDYGVAGVYLAVFLVVDLYEFSPYHLSSLF